MPFKNKPDRSELRNRLIGLGEKSVRKSYYRQLVATSEELSNRESYLKALFESTTDFFLTLDNNRVIRDCNPALLHTFGYEKHEVIDQPAIILHFSRKSYDDFGETVYREIEKTGLWRGEWVFKTKNNEPMPLEIVVAAMHDAGGHKVGYVSVLRDISERKKTEEALHARERELRTLVENLPDLISRFDREGRFIFTSPSFTKRFKRPSKHFLGNTISDLKLNDREQSEYLQNLIQKAWAQKKPNSCEATWRSGEDEYFYELRHIPELDEKGEVVSILGIARDITERKRAEHKQVSNLKFLEGMDQINRAIQGNNDLDGMMGDVLERVLKIFDCDRAWLVYPCDPEASFWTVPMERTKPGYPGAHVLGAKIPLRKDEAFGFQALLAADGPMRFDPESNNPMPEEVAKRFGFKSFISMALRPKIGKAWQFGLHQCSYARVWTPEDVRLFQEIGRRLSDALGLLLAHRVLKESEERYRLVVDQASDALFLTDFQGAIHDVNHAACTSLGYSREELLGLSIKKVVPSAQPYQQGDAVWDQLSQGKSVSIESEHQRKDGSLFPVEASLGTLEIGGQKMLLALARDISERKRGEEEKDRLEAQLRQASKMQAIGILAGGIAHDFNNLLTAIMGFGELARLHVDEGEGVATQLDHIVNAAGRASDLVNQLLTFSRRSEVELKTIDINRLVSESLAILERTIPKMVDINMRLGRQLSYVRGDPTQLEQVIMNLANNARDAMPDGGSLVFETSMVEVDQEYAEQYLDLSPGDYVLLRVSDTGQGMEANIAEKIFDPFFTTKEIGKGTGLGLSTVYGIIMEHAGHISCNSVPGKGTTFSIYLPAYLAEDEDAIRLEASQEPLLGGNETILLVDDEKIIRELGTELLQGQGYQIITASSGEEAIERLQNNLGKINLVILDLGMPGMGGYKCFRELLAIDPDLKILIASGYSAEGQLKDILEQGAATYIAKPFKRLDLINSVRRALDA